MWRKGFALCLTVALMQMIAGAYAADSGADPLSYEELCAWTDSLKVLAADQEVLNDPTAEEALSEDGYAYVYDFGTLYYDRPDGSPERILWAAVLYDEEVAGPRGLNTYSPASQLLEAFYLENESLSGRRDSAILYLADDLPEGFWWGRVQRDGQRLEAVQYAVHELVQDEIYTDAGLVFTIQDGTVAAIRVYGLDDFVLLGDLQAEERLLQIEYASTEYTAVPSGADGLDLTVLTAEDLTIGGLDFLSATPEQAAALFGEPEADTSVPDGEGTLRTLTFAECELTFATDAEGRTVLAQAVITGDELEGPRGFRRGDTFSSCLRRVRNGEGTFDGEREMLYGTEGEAPWGLAEYGVTNYTLHFAVDAGNGETVMVLVEFELLELTELSVFILSE